MPLPVYPVDVTRVESSGSEAWTLFWKRDFRFLPGQVVALSVLPAGEQRLYSLATGSEDEEAGVLFNLAPDGWLTRQLQAVKPGCRLYCSAPFGSFTGSAGPAMWIANGTGVAPFLSMVLSGQSQEKCLIQGARTRSQFFGQDLLSRQLGDSYVRCASSDSGNGLVSGRLTAYLENREWPSDRPYYLCGSAAMIVEARDILIRKGVPFRNIVSEVYF